MRLVKRQNTWHGLLLELQQAHTRRPGVLSRRKGAATATAHAWPVGDATRHSRKTGGVVMLLVGWLGKGLQWWSVPRRSRSAKDSSLLATTQLQRGFMIRWDSAAKAHTAVCTDAGMGRVYA